MRQLLVSSGVAASYTANVLATGAIDVVGESDGVTGFTSLLPGETISDYSRIRIIQGTALGNIVSPWIEDIFLKKKKIKYTKYQNFEIHRLTLKKIGFKKAAKLKEVYKIFKKLNFELVPPELSLYLRLIY